MEDILIDKRIVERNIVKGLISKEEYEKHCAELPDLADECEVIDVSLYNDDDEEKEDGEQAPEGDDPAPEVPIEG